jgi:two-component system NtrC family sensor kinase
LQRHFLLWLMLAGILPLLLLLAAKRLDSELSAELVRLASLMDEPLSQRGKLLQSIGRSPALYQFAASLQEVLQRQTITADFSHHKTSLENFLLDLQPLIPEDAVIRIVDQAGRTLIKIRFGATTRPVLESLTPYQIIELEAEDRMVEILQGLPAGEVGHVVFPGAATDYYPLSRLPLLDAVLPVTPNGYRLYVVFSNQGQQLDHLLAMAPRIREAQMRIVDEPLSGSRRMLFDDASGLGFASLQAAADTAETPPFLSAMEFGEIQVLKPDNGEDARQVVLTYQPYPDRLGRWLLMARLDPEAIASDLKLLRGGLLGLTVFSVLLSLLLSGWAARHLARPIQQLAENIQAYGRGEPQMPPIPSGVREVKDVQLAFTDLSSTLQQAEQQLLQSARMASIGEMAAGIGHELNNPLNNIRSLTKLLQRYQPENSDYQSDVAALSDETRRATHIVRGILDFARQTPPQYAFFSISHWLHQCVQRMNEAVKEKSVSITLNHFDDISIEGDADQLEQVMINLLTNAIQASPFEGDVRINVQEQAEQVCIQVLDQGEGLDDDTLMRAFEPFFTTKLVGQGSGLGLSISHGIVQSHGGSLRLNNNDGGGAMAEMCLPRNRQT